MGMKKTLSIAVSAGLVSSAFLVGASAAYAKDPVLPEQAKKPKESSAPSPEASPSPSPSTAPSETPVNEGVCAGLDSGKIDVSGGKTVTVTAPAGYVIDQYCVKAGSIKQGNGPEYVSVNLLESVTFGHSSGKDISHYSVSWTTKPTPTQSPSPSPSPSPTSSPSPSPSPTSSPSPSPSQTSTPLSSTPPSSSPEPLIVSAPAAGTTAEGSGPEAVSAPRPATVSVPAAATLPSAVPAGDGSTAPNGYVPAAIIALAAIAAASAGYRLIRG